MATRTAAQRSASARKGARTRKKNQSKGTRKRSTSRATTTTRRRRATPRKKGMLSELFNPKMATAGATAMLSGAIGGIGTKTIISLTPNTEVKYQNMIIGGGAFVSAVVLKKPNIAAGMMGALIYKMMGEAGLGENAYYADPIEQLPMVLNENGEPMDLQDNEMYLQEGEDMYLQDDGYQVGYYGSGFGGGGYAQ